MSRKNSLQGYLPKVCLIIIIVGLFFCITIVAAVSATKIQAPEPTIIQQTTTGNPGSAPNMHSTVGQVVEGTQKIQVEGTQNYDPPNVLELSERINDLKIQLEDAQTAIVKLKQSNDVLTSTVDTQKESIKELKLSVEENKQNIGYLIIIVKSLRELIELTQGDTTIFDDFDQKTNELYKLLEEVIKNMNEVNTNWAKNLI